jgi:hypothetical protein
VATDDEAAGVRDAPADQEPGGAAVPGVLPPAPPAPHDVKHAHARVPDRPHEAPDHRSDAAYVLVLAISDRQITYNAILLVGALGAVASGISATWLFLGSHTPWGVVLTGGSATLMVTAGTARWVVRRLGKDAGER